MGARLPWRAGSDECISDYAVLWEMQSDGASRLSRTASSLGAGERRSPEAPRNVSQEQMERVL